MKLDVLIKDKKIREKFSKNSRKLALTKYDVKIFVKKNLLNYTFE